MADDAQLCRTDRDHVAQRVESWRRQRFGVSGGKPSVDHVQPIDPLIGQLHPDDGDVAAARVHNRGRTRLDPPDSRDLRQLRNLFVVEGGRADDQVGQAVASRYVAQRLASNGGSRHHPNRADGQ